MKYQQYIYFQELTIDLDIGQPVVRLSSALLFVSSGCLGSCSVHVHFMCLTRPEFPCSTHHPNCQHSAAKRHGRMGLEQTRYHKRRFEQ